MPTKGWHFVRTFYCGWHFVRPNFWLAFCPDHLNHYGHLVPDDGGRTKCQPDKMPTKGWHFVRPFFCGWHFVRPNFWLAFCPEHLNMFWLFVQIMKNVVMP